MNNKFIIIKATDGCIHPGLIHYANEKTDKIIILIHGSGGNFYKMKFYENMQKEFNNHNIDFMIVNNRGSEQYINVHQEVGGISKVFKGGSIYENFEESIYDVEGVVNYARELGYKDICLLGESLGTLKVQYYLNERNDINKIILLSPVDMISRFKARVKDDYDKLIEKSKQLVEEGNPYEMVTNEFSAIKILSTMTTNSKADIYKLEEDRESYPLNYNGNVLVIVGENNHCNKDWGINYLENKMKKNYGNAKFEFKVIEGANHIFKDHGEQLAKEIYDSYSRM